MRSIFNIMNETANVRIGIDMPLPPPAAFDALVAEFAAGLERVGIQFTPGPDGRLIERGFEAGRIVAWRPGEQMLLRWRSADWLADEVTELDLRLEAIEGGTRAVLEHRACGRFLGAPEELAGWFSNELAAPFIRAMAPAALGDWVTDRRARRPTGVQSRSIYGHPVYHYPNFRVILAELALKPEDYLVEVGCGGGALLKDALQSGCRAAAVDHSPEMVHLAREQNQQAIGQGRLVVHHAGAEKLPFTESTFTKAVMTGVLGFLPDPVGAFREIRRVLKPGGKFVALGSDPEMRGTPAAPEPMASRLRFYSEAQLDRLARDAGFQKVQVARRSLEQFAKEAGVPQEHLALFAGPGPAFLVVTKDS
jgi:ubiquinone/menaquinone biosynthesis C-methylase UbiE